jgi:1A family penicillin-binding protein
MKYNRGSNVPSRRARKASKKVPVMNVFLLSKLLKWALVGLVVFIVLFLGFAVWVSRDLPAPGKLASASIKDSTKIIDRNGTILYSIYNNYNRIYVNLDQIPKNLRNATIATEDSTFYENNGFSWKGYARAAVGLVIHHGAIEGGGSTITQQLVKNVLLTSNQTFTRKLKELILAVQVDKRYSKDQILEMYLNNIPYGGTSIGVEAAANLYFNKHVKDLDLAQSAFLAGLPQSPSYYSPYINPDKAYLGRSQTVLQRMVTTGYISQKQADAAYKEIKGFTFSNSDQANIKAPHFVMDVRSKLVKMFGEGMVANGDLTVKTTLDYSIQQQAEKTVKTELDSLKGYHVSNGAALVLDAKTGAVLAMVGSKDYFDQDNQGNFNAVYASRQPGSSTKPILYATAFEKGYTPATLLMDTPTDFYMGANQPPYKPVNYEGTFSGPMQVRYALGNSENIPAVKMLAMVGIKNFMEKAYDMGITNWQPTQQNLSQVGLSLVLGGREASLFQVTSAYQVFADQGVKKEPFEITEVDSSNGKVLYKHENDPGTKVLSPEVSFLISHILSDDSARQAAFGSHSWLYVSGKTVSVKTGTTDDKKDNWTIGYTPSYVVGVWVGNNDDTPMNQAIASGITGASPIWNKIISSILAGKKDEPEPKPDDVVAMQIDALGGGLPVDGQPIRAEYFIKGTEPTAPSPIYKQIKVSKQDNNKLANSDEISHGDYDVKDFIVFQENDPVSTDGTNRWQQGIDSWVNEHYKDDPKYPPPTETSDRN